jgi:thiamine-phosphate pyrophosphorylase
VGTGFPPLHVVTDDRVVKSSIFLAQARAVLAAGGARLVLHLRAPRASGRMVFECARALVPVARYAGATLLVNDRCDVALAARAHGVHLGGRSLSPAAARRLVGDEMLLGQSVHPSAEDEVELNGRLDFLVVGTLFATGSHPGRSPAGVDALGRFSGVGIPLVGIGGITVDRVGAVRHAGASGIAVLGGVWNSPDPGEATEAYLQAWSGVE